MSSFFDQAFSGTGLPTPAPPAKASTAAGVDSLPRPPVETPPSLKTAVQELLRYGSIEAASKPHVYQTLCSRSAALQAILEPLDLRMRLDEVRGLAFLCVAGRAERTDSEPASESPAPSDDLGVEEHDAWTHPLVRRQRLTAEQTLLLAMLRRHFIAHEQQAGLGAGTARVALSDLWAELSVYLGASGSDRQDDKRLRDLLQKLREHGAVSDVEPDDTVALRPILAHLLDPASLEGVLQQFLKMKALP